MLGKQKSWDVLGEITSLPLLMFLESHHWLTYLLLHSSSQRGGRYLITTWQPWGDVSVRWNHVLKVPKHERSILSPFIPDSWNRNLQRRLTLVLGGAVPGSVLISVVTVGSGVGMLTGSLYNLSFNPLELLSAIKPVFSSSFVWLL